MSTQSVPGGWLSNPAAVPNSFANPDPGMHAYDSAAVLSQPAVIDPSHFQAQQLQNGSSRNSSPGFQGSAYSVNSIVPLKRPRARDDSIGSLSPRPGQQGLPPSRSQTPLQQNQLSYQVYNNGSQQPQGQYRYNAPPHLQHVGSADASPSPVMQNQQFNQPAPKRVATQSPSPFSPAPSQQGFMSQGSPPPQSHTPRVDTPQNGNGMSMPPQQAYSQPYTQGFQSPAPTASASPGPNSGPNMAQNQMHAQVVYAQMQARQHQQQQHQQQHQHQQQMMQQQQVMRGQMGQMPPGTMDQNHPGNQQPRPQQQQPMQHAQQPGPAGNPQQFMKSLSEFMMKRGTPITSAPMVSGKQVNIVTLYGVVIKMGGSQRVSAENKWQHVSMALGYSPEHYPTAVDEMVAVYRAYLAPYEEAWMRNQQQMRQKQMQARNNQMTPQGQQHQRAPSNGPMPTQQQRPPPVLTRPPSQMQNNQVRPPSMNGYPPQAPPTPRQSTPQHQPPSTPNRASVDVSPSPVNSIPPGFPMAKPGAPISESSFSLQPPPSPMKGIPAEYKPKQRPLDTYGGVDLRAVGPIGADLMYHRPTAPTYHELGLIDIHALTMMLKSGLPAEVKVALDALATVSVEARQSIALESCEDLLEALVDVAETQVEFLGEHAPEASDVVSMMSYEDVLRACRVERDSLLDVARFGTDEHDLDRAADRLLCITTILRNLSFFESNHNSLAGANVIRFLSSVIEQMGTCPLFLRTYLNLLDFMKDMVIYLSNLAHAIVLPSEEEALNLLHLILAFSPQPLPHIAGREELMFTPYQPSVHRYLPPAVDTLAKLLARDEPNRAFFRTIYLSETDSTPPYDLLTRSFALAISPIPDSNRAMQKAIEARSPILEQGLLVADILAQIVPGPDKGIARSWLLSEDGFSLSLLRLVCQLSPHVSPLAHQPQRGHQKLAHEDIYPFSRITHRGMSVLRKLAEKSEDPLDENMGIPQGVLPKKESLLGALLTIHIDGTVVKELCSYAGLDG